MTLLVTEVTVFSYGGDTFGFGGDSLVLVMELALLETEVTVIVLHVIWHQVWHGVVSL